jgi:hypothetical protein
VPIKKEDKHEGWKQIPFDHSVPRLETDSLVFLVVRATAANIVLRDGSLILLSPIFSDSPIL